MFQFYLRRKGIALSWVGTGRFIFNFSYDDQEFEQVVQSVLEAAHEMHQDGWWTFPEGLTPAKVQQHLIREVVRDVLRLE